MSEMPVFVLSFFVSAFAGLASLLRGQDPITTTRLASAFLNSGLLGLGVCMLWYYQFQDRVYSLVGLCILLGLSGNTAVEWVLAALKKGGFSIQLGDKQGQTTITGDPNDPNKTP